MKNERKKLNLELSSNDVLVYTIYFTCKIRENKTTVKITMYTVVLSKVNDK